MSEFPEAVWLRIDENSALQSIHVVNYGAQLTTDPCYIRTDLIDQGIKDALKERWTGVRNKIVDKLQDQITDDQLQVVLQIIDDEQWFPAIAEAIRNGEAEEVEG